MATKHDLCAPGTKRPEGSTSIERYGYHYITGEIDEDVCTKAIKFILEANLNREVDYDYLTLIINSEGGNVTDGFALIEVIQSSRIPIRTIGLGIISSMALVIFMSGTESRILSKNTIVMSHQWSDDEAAGGKHDDLVAYQRQVDITQGIFLRYYEQFTGFDKDVILAELLNPSDKWLTAAEAKKLGICDKVKGVL